MVVCNKVIAFWRTKH